MTDWKPARRIVNTDLLRIIALEHDCCEAA